MKVSPIFFLMASSLIIINLRIFRIWYSGCHIWSVRPQIVKLSRELIRNEAQSQSLQVNSTYDCACAQEKFGYF